MRRAISFGAIEPMDAYVTREQCDVYQQLGLKIRASTEQFTMSLAAVTPALQRLAEVTRQMEEAAIVAGRQITWTSK